MLMMNRPAMQGAMISCDGSPLPYYAPREWFALVVRPNKEMDTADWLKVRNFAAYWPNYVSHEGSSRGVAGARLIRRPRYRAVIPGYIFLGVNAGSGDPFAVSRDAPGVYGWLRTTGGGPLRVAETDIDTIRRIEADENLPPPVGPMHSFKSGEKVRVVADIVGNWQTGIVSRLDRDGRIVVEIPGLLGRVTPVHFHPHQIEPLQVTQAQHKRKLR